MNELPRFTWRTLLSLVVVLACAAGARCWYVAQCSDNGRRDPAILVQGPRPGSFDNLVENLAEHQRFECEAPLADEQEATAHLAPGYPLLCASVVDWFDPAAAILRWLQCTLGSLTAGCYFFLARRSFHSTPIATLAGLLVAINPFWVINTAELNDGVLASFALGVSLALGARAGQTGGAFTGLLFGVALAGATLVRAAFLPFALVALLWFLWQCRRFPLGWFAGFLTLLGFVNGLAPWMFWTFQVFDAPVPVTTTAYLHLWMGNCPHTTGSTLDEAALRASLPPERLEELLAEPNQANRYRSLGPDVWNEIEEHPTQTLSRRIKAALVFFLGERWFKQQQLAVVTEDVEPIAAAPDWLTEHVETILHATLLGVSILALLGWRWSYAWRRYGGALALALLWIPLPYVLSHADAQLGPRLPLEGVLLCFVAFALASLIPGMARSPSALRDSAQALG